MTQSGAWFNEVRGHTASSTLATCEFRSRRRDKTDRNDARGIAQEMRPRLGTTLPCQDCRHTEYGYAADQPEALKRKLTDLENYIRGAVRGYDYSLELLLGVPTTRASAS